MLKGLKFVFSGIIFGIIMAKSEAISWYRIQEMFRFQSFHMYGIIGTAVVVGVLAHLLIKRSKARDIDGQPIVVKDKAKTWTRYILGGTIFGIGWALTGACPGPIFVSFGYGYGSFAVIIASATLGTFIYGLVRNSLPH